MDDAAGMTGQEGASPSTVVSVDDAAGMTGEGSKEGAGPRTIVCMDDAAGMIGGGGQQGNLSPPSSMVSATSAVVHDTAGFSLAHDDDGATKAVRGVNEEQITQVIWSSIFLFYLLCRFIIYKCVHIILYRTLLLLSMIAFMLMTRTPSLFFFPLNRVKKKQMRFL